jgi:UDP-MurNAc hydroxylase
MRVRYIYSAGVTIETEDVRILCDPWFTQGAYDGSWHQWPEVEDPVGTIGPMDLIYVSHIHPDHYDPAFLRSYLQSFPAARIIIGRQSPPILEQKMRADGFKAEVVTSLEVGETRITIVPNRGRDLNIDTALVVRRGDKSVANFNDNPFDELLVADVLGACGGSPTMALLPYGGATAHPQTFLFPSEAELLDAVRVKERHFLDVFHRYIEALAPKVVLPFAGKYWLAGPLAALNARRGIPDAVAAAAEAPDCAVVLADGGRAYFDLQTMTASEVRTQPYDEREVDRFLAGLDFPGYTYEREIRPDPDRAFPFLPLLNAALRRARERYPVTEPYWVCIRPHALGKYLCFDPAASGDATVWDGPGAPEHLEPRLEIFIDDRYLFGLLSRLYHWNNASIGSHYTCRRTPDVFRRDVFHFLDYLQV